MANTPAMILCRGHNNPLLKCKGMQSEKDFYMSRSPLAYWAVEIKGAKEGKIPYCKTCVQKIFEYELERSRDIRSATYYTCQRLDIPFMVVLFNDAILKSKGKTIVDATKVNQKLMGEYIGLLNLNKAKYGKSIDFSCSDTTLSGIDTSIDEIKRNKKELERFHLDWGIQESEEDYALLEYDFYELTSGIPLFKSQEMLYRDLCLARLAKRKAEQSKDGDIQKIQKQILDLMKILRIDNFAENKEQTIIERMLESRINDLEKHDPAQYYNDLKKNADFCGRSKYFYDHIYRPFKNTFTGSKLYKITPEEEDEMVDEDYEKLMSNEKVKKED